MITYYNGYNITWLDDGTFNVVIDKRLKRFVTLRQTMDYIDKLWKGKQNK